MTRSKLLENALGWLAAAILIWAMFALYGAGLEREPHGQADILVPCRASDTITP